MSDALIDDLQRAAYALWMQQAHVAAGKSWQLFLAELGVLTPQHLPPPRQRPQEASSGPSGPTLPGFS